MSDSSCIYVDNEGERPKRFKEEFRVAKKKYRCDECFGVIDIGKKYQYVRGLWYDSYVTYRTCDGCLNIIDSLFCSRPNFGDLEETLRDAMGIGLDGLYEEEDALFPCPKNHIKCSNNSCGECWYEYWDSIGYNVIEDKIYQGHPVWLLAEQCKGKK